MACWSWYPVSISFFPEVSLWVSKFVSYWFSWSHKKGYKRTSLIKPDDSWRHNIPPKNIYVAFLGPLLCPSVDKGKVESIYPIHQQLRRISCPCDTKVHLLKRTTVDGFHWRQEQVREAKVWYGRGLHSHTPFFR